MSAPRRSGAARTRCSSGPRHTLYRDYSREVWSTIREIVPTVEQAGIDEGYLDLGEVAPLRRRARARRGGAGGRAGADAALVLARRRDVEGRGEGRLRPAQARRADRRAARAARRRSSRRSRSACCRASARAPRSGCARSGSRRSAQLAALERRASSRGVLRGQGRPRAPRPRPRDRPAAARGVDRADLDLAGGDLRARRRRPRAAARRAARGWPPGSPSTCTRRGQVARTVTTKVRYPDFAIRTRSTSLPVGIDDAARIGELACALLDRALRDRPGAAAARRRRRLGPRGARATFACRRSSDSSPDVAGLSPFRSRHMPTNADYLEREMSERQPIKIHEHVAKRVHVLLQRAGVPYEVEQQVCTACSRILDEKPVKRASSLGRPLIAAAPAGTGAPRRAHSTRSARHQRGETHGVILAASASARALCLRWRSSALGLTRGSRRYAATTPAIQTFTPRSERQITNIDVLRQQIRNYYGDPLGTGTFAGRQQLRARKRASVARDGERYLESQVARPRPHARATKAILLDVDDTTLATWNYEIASELGVQPDDQRRRSSPTRSSRPCRAWSSSPTRRPSEGYAVFFLTGRPADAGGSDARQPRPATASASMRLPGADDAEGRRGRAVHEAGRRRLSELSEDRLRRRPERLVHDDPLQVRDARAHRVARLRHRRQLRRPVQRSRGGSRRPDVQAAEPELLPAVSGLRPPRGRADGPSAAAQNVSQLPAWSATVNADRPQGRSARAGRRSSPRPHAGARGTRRAPAPRDTRVRGSRAEPLLDRGVALRRARTHRPPRASRARLRIRAQRPPGLRVSRRISNPSAST